MLRANAVMGAPNRFGWKRAAVDCLAGLALALSSTAHAAQPSEAGKAAVSTAQASEETDEEFGRELERLGRLHATPLFARAESWICLTQQRVVCGPEGCEHSQLTDRPFFELDGGGSIYSRCDAKGCTRRQSVSSKSGIYTIVDIPGSGTFMKLVNDGTEFVDVATSGTAAFVSHGVCQPK